MSTSKMVMTADYALCLSVCTPSLSVVTVS
jgi:hypothetical protein